MKTLQKNGNVIIALYSHPEYFPPTINAIINLADYFDEVNVLYAPIKENNWPWPNNVTLTKGGNPKFYKNGYRLNGFIKIYNFFLFLFNFLKSIHKIQPKIILVYDNYALLSLRLCRLFIKLNSLIWYHSHDINENKKVPSKFSILYWVIKNEKSFLCNIDVFTVPSKDRINYFDTSQINGLVKVIPNFPSLKFFKTPTTKILDKTLKVVFIGSIAEGRGLMEFVNLLPLTISGVEIELKIIGYQSNSKLINNLLDLIHEKKLEKIVSIQDPIPYSELKTVGNDANLGLGFYLSDSIMDRTISTASNKIFEYAAMGLPVISNITLPKSEWLISSTPSENEIKNALKFCIDNYQRISQLAYVEFTNKYYFEYNFIPFLNEVLELCNAKFQHN